jgi:hypoxanthine-DNA glycosylase
MSADDPTALAAGFPAVSDPDARVLILGSLPGARSIAEQRYYAHPQNAFWPIMRELLGIDGDYSARCRKLTAAGIALWDVLESSRRPGSMDADIDLSSARANDFPQFFRRHLRIERICFNGRKAEVLFRRFVVGNLGDVAPPAIGLPSTSPAYASMPYETKLERWRAGLAGLVTCA